MEADTNISIVFLSREQRPMMMHGLDAEVVSADARPSVQIFASTIFSRSLQSHVLILSQNFLLCLWSRIISQNKMSESFVSILDNYVTSCATLYPESFPNMQSHVLIWILWPGMWEMWLQKIPVNPKSDLFIPILHLKGREVHTPDIYIAVKKLHKKDATVIHCRNGHVNIGA